MGFDLFPMSPQVALVIFIVLLCVALMCCRLAINAANQPQTDAEGDRTMWAFIVSAALALLFLAGAIAAVGGMVWGGR